MARWTKEKVIQEIKRLHRAGKDLSYNAMTRSLQALVSAGAYHFGSYRRAVERAGIDYAEVTRRPRWTRAKIIQLIKQARRAERDLHWSAVTGRKDELSRAAFAALQPRLFGSWDRALHAAGLDADEISRYRRWDRSSIIFELKDLYRGGEPINSGAMQAEDPGLHAAAMRHFGSYDAALRAAGIVPERVRRRKQWSKAAVVAAIRAAHKAGRSLA